MSEEMRDLVKKGYEEGDFVGAYERTSEELENFEKCMCDELISKVKKGGSVLDRMRNRITLRQIFFR